jgi:3-hydroxyacyl-[acyl-carrier-protein] dehydratase
VENIFDKKRNLSGIRIASSLYQSHTRDRTHNKNKPQPLFNGKVKRKDQRMLQTNDILKVLPHKHPYLLVDRIAEIEAGRKVVGIKAVSYAESVFAGHYPDDPVWPGALLIEASSQVAGFLAGAQDNMMGYVVEISRFQFKKQVKPGCLLRIETTKKSGRGPFLEAEVRVTADETLMAQGTLQLFIRKNGDTPQRMQ